jgi:eukaryotic translation initiation factor 2C
MCFISTGDSVSLLNTVTVKLHFQETYNIRIRYSDIFGINISGRKNPHPSVIPAELCEVIPGQLYKRKVPEYLTAKVVDFAKVKPQDRFRKITQSVRYSSALYYLNSSYILF